jgi:serine protease Do
MPNCMVLKIKVLFVLLCGFLSFEAVSSEPPLQERSPALNGGIKSILAAASLEISEIYNSAKKSVVIVESPPLNAHPTAWDSPPQVEDSTEDLGSITDTATGIVFSSEGYVLTNHHVIQNVVSEYVRVKLPSGEIVRAKIVGTDPKTDLAVLLLPSPLAALPKGDSDSVKVGDFVCAIGSPYGLEYSLSIGVVSGRGRNPLTHSAYEDYIQTDAAINPGNSGGPLINNRGEWVGVNTLMNGINRGLGFAIPSNQAIRIAEEIVAKGQINRPWLGLRAAVEPSFEDPQGVRLAWIQPDSPAERAGLRPGDIIKKVNGSQVKSPPALQRKIWDAGIGKSIELEVERGGRIRKKRLTTLAMPEGELPN